MTPKASGRAILTSLSHKSLLPVYYQVKCLAMVHETFPDVALLYVFLRALPLQLQLSRVTGQSLAHSTP